MFGRSKKRQSTDKSPASNNKRSSERRIGTGSLSSIDIPLSRTYRISQATDLLHVNVGGSRFTLMNFSLQNLPQSRLTLFSNSSHKEKLAFCEGFDESSGIYFFNRSNIMFDAIVDVYRSGCVHVPDCVCVDSFIAELEYWNIPEEFVAPCCEYKMTPPPESTLSTEMVNGTGVSLPLPKVPTKTKYEALRHRVWILLENPSSSAQAMVFMVLSCIMVFTTVVVLIMSSLPDFQYIDVDTNQTMDDVNLEIADSVCVGWFSLEYVLRLWSAPERWVYVKSALSIIDLTAIIPFFVELIFNNFGWNIGLGDFRRSFVVMRILRILRVLRALRVLKVARYSAGFQSMGSALRKSWRELSLLMMFMLTANLMFSTAMYYLEVDHPATHFSSIPEACWWCIITMTTVGYGDVYPKTVAGKILGGVVSITGIILLAFPISVIVETFNEEYQESQSKQRQRDFRTQAKSPILPVATDRPSALAASAALVSNHLATSVKIIDGKLYWEVNRKRRRFLCRKQSSSSRICSNGSKRSSLG